MGSLMSAAVVASFSPPTYTASPHMLGLAIRHAPAMTTVPSPATRNVPLEYLEPSPVLAPREVIGSVMAALHRSNWDTPRSFYGFEIALRFLAPTHQAKLKRAKPGGFSRFMRQPHKVQQITWNEYRFDGEVIMLRDADGREEAYQMCTMRSSPTDEWMAARWKLVNVDCDYGEIVKRQWMVEAVFANEPDTPEDIEFLRAREAPGAVDMGETPRAVVDKVMRALRHMDEPLPLHGASMATRYCSPNNRASELSPEVFARYLEDPWYSILAEWDEMKYEADEYEDEDSEGALDECTVEEGGVCSQVEIEVLVRRAGEVSFTMVGWELSLYDGQWLIDTLNIVS